ncbi:cysteine dioxygenase family protein [Streptomyces sp. ACA25]|uniref:cysteine dioxygenase n=1 Tax=Streptomyces sp. ACA25 TaxID=3022596 RepID=UPI00230745FD|nr:cysteine dioxygenase family protein [Streptomyces sp. ACA25]MDB1087162.1 cysteine dioxygenase family protein [Streptomyces sp. ACA25]
MSHDNEIAGDPLALPHLLRPAPEHPSTLAQFAGLATALASDRAAWAPHIRYDAASRWYHRLRTGPGYEAWLLSWVPGQGSGRHDHGPSSGVFTVLDGELTEYPGIASPHPRILAPGSVEVRPPGYVHEVVNSALAPAVSLHIYFPGLTEMPQHARVFEERGGGLAEPCDRSAASC